METTMKTAIVLVMCLGLLLAACAPTPVETQEKPAAGDVSDSELNTVSQDIDATDSDVDTSGLDSLDSDFDEIESADV